MKRILILSAILAMSAGIADAKVTCKDPVTHKFIKCPVAAAAPTHTGMSSMVASSTDKAPHCVKGKVCGHSCIALKDVCHK